MILFLISGYMRSPMARKVGNNQGVTDLIADLQWRGLIQDSTDLDALRAHVAAGPVTFYTGVDPSAQSMQVGNLVQQLTARRLQQAGQPVIHRPRAWRIP